MASETKRQNAANKIPVALPKSEPAQPAPSTVSLEVALRNAIGGRIRITTAAPTSTTLEGTLFTADPITNLVAIQTSSSSSSSNTSNLSFPSGSYRILPISQITNFQLLSLPTTNTTPTPSPKLTPLDTTNLQTRLHTNVAALQMTYSRLGPKGTTPETQAIFDGLSRTYPIKWSGTSMLVSDSMIIEKPYQPANCRLVSGMSGRPGEVERIKKVLDMERQKVLLKGAKERLDGSSSGGVIDAVSSAAGGEGRKGG